MEGIFSYMFTSLIKDWVFVATAAAAQQIEGTIYNTTKTLRPCQLRQIKPLKPFEENNKTHRLFYTP